MIPRGRSAPPDIQLIRAAAILAVLALGAAILTPSSRHVGSANRISFLVFAVCLGVALGGVVRRWRLRRKPR